MPRLRVLCDEPCTVCQGKPASVHYGAVVCGNCKMFFLRGVRRGVCGSCDNPGECEDILGCAPCRFAKCVAQGMKKQDVGLQTRHRLELAKCHLFPPLAHYLTSYETPFLRCLKLLRDDDPSKLAYCLLQLEKFCDSDYSTSNDGFSYNLDVSFSDAFVNPTSICDRVPMGYGDPHPDRYGLPANHGVSRIFVRNVLHYIDWCRGCIELSELDHADRILFCRQQYYITDFLTSAYNSYKYDYDGLLYSFGCRLKKFPTFASPRYLLMRRFAERLEDMALMLILSVMHDISISPEEYVLLKKIVFYTSPIVISDRTTVFINVQRRRHEEALIQYLIETFGTTKAKFRLLKLLSLMEPLARMVLFSDNNRAMFTLFNDYDGTQTKLREDMNIRRKT